MAALGAAIFMTGSSAMPLWATWVVGPLLWFFGFAMLVAWALRRMLDGPGLAQEKTALEARPERKRIIISNFLEHDYADIA